MSAAAYAAMVCAGAAAWLTVDRNVAARRATVLFVDGDGADAGRAGDGRWAWAASWRRWRVGVVLRARRLRGEWLCLPVAGVLAVLGDSVLPLIGGAVAVPLVRRRLRARERAKAAERRAGGVVALCGAAAGELRSGAQPVQALLAAAVATGGLGDAEAPVVAAARFGGEVPEALRQAAREPGCEGLAGLAACWRVAVDGGAGLAAGLDRLEAALRAEREQREDLRAQLAGAWSTVVVLALLPVLALAMGWALGADPLRVLLHTPAGLGCLAVGGLLEGAGLWWAGRIVRMGVGT
ncbi:type II secretion system F family protein [Streptomyces sp. NBC_01317]|uniref:type II secretion system F family protein n=1 Tax=Streptomyces sp. NBC_01317 TaxID=2903822 RepID=UPI002E11B0D3|nr:type II secretion system F family protein [Streptomyces sp. NBC_01317]